MTETEKRKSSRQRSAPASPLGPYRSIIERNPVEEHFTSKQLRKHMRHVGMIPPPVSNRDSGQSSLARDEYQIRNSRRERFRQFRRQFITTMADNIQEIDQARQAEFRNQLELWEKMYSNRIQRIKSYDKRLERKYGLFVDREMKKELIRENLTKLPDVPSVSIPRIIPDVVPRQPPKKSSPISTKLQRTPSTPPLHQYVDEARSRLEGLVQRLAKLEEDFCTFQNDAFHDCRSDVDSLKTNVEMLANARDAVQDTVNKLEREIEELQTYLNEVVKDQDMLKIIQLEHEGKISQLTAQVATLETETKVFEKVWEEFTKIRQEQANDKQALETEDKRRQNEIDQIFDSLKQLDFTHAIVDINTRLQMLSGSHERFSGMHDQLRIEFEAKKKTVEKLDQQYGAIAGRVKSIEDGKTDLGDHMKLRLEFDNLKDKIGLIEGYVTHMPDRIDTLERGKVDHTDYGKTKETVDKNKKTIDELQRKFGELAYQRGTTAEQPIFIDNSSEIAALRLEINNVRETHSAKIQSLDNEVSLLKRRLQALETEPKPINTYPRAVVQDAINYDEDLKIIQDKQKEFDHFLMEFSERMRELQGTFASFDSKIIRLDDKIDQQRRDLEQMINDGVSAFERKIMTLREELLDFMSALKKTIDEELKKVREETATLKARIDKLEGDMKKLKPVETRKEDALPYVEKFVPIDLFEINWKKHRSKKQENTIDQ